MTSMRACVLSGGASSRMGRDKALLPHPSGGVWLSALVTQLRAMPLPVVVVSGHASHRSLLQHWPQVEVVPDALQPQGPLQALAEVLSPEPGRPLLVAPVDMPLLTSHGLQQLVDAWRQEPLCAAVADDGVRLQPLLGVYPSGDPFQPRLMAQLAQGNRRWMDWLGSIPHRPVRLPARQLCNLNAAADLAALTDDC